MSLAPSLSVADPSGEAFDEVERGSGGIGDGETTIGWKTGDTAPALCASGESANVGRVRSEVAISTGRDGPSEAGGGGAGEAAVALGSIGPARSSAISKEADSVVAEWRVGRGGSNNEFNRG